jgi:flagellar biogenesis protein FliO
MAFAALTFACAVQPLAAQSNQSSAAASGTQAAAGETARAQVPESQIPLGSNAAAAATGGAPQRAAGGGVTTWDFVRMLIILAAIIGVIYLLFWLLRRGAGRKVQENDLIHVLGSRTLASNRALHLVEVGSSIYLVGSSEGGVELIAEITEKESLDTVRLKAAEQAPATRRNFQQILSEIFRPAKKSYSVGEGIGFLRGQRDRLKKL